MALPVYIPPSSVQELPFLHIFIRLGYLLAV